MGFTGFDDLAAEITGGKTWRSDWAKIYAATDVYGAGTVAAGRWYDMTGYAQQPYAHGNYLYNAHFQGGLAGWTPSSANVAWDAVNTRANKTGGSSETLIQNTDCVNGTTYEVTYAVSGFSAGTVTVSLGGTAGTARSSNAVFTENIVCGATANAPLTFTFSAAWSAGGVENVIVRRLLAFTPYADNAKGREAGIWHGGNVSSDTKHITVAGAWTTAATGAGAVIYIVDLLGCYPKIQTNSASAQTLNNTLSLPRYTDGKGVRAFYVLNTANGANAQNFSLNYTTTGPTAGRSLGAVVANTASAIPGHLSHTGVAAGNFGPFLPLGAGDPGIVSAESAQFSAASASAGFVDLVLCKPLLAIPVTTAFIAAERDLVSQLPSLPRVYDGAVLGILIQAGAVVAGNTQWQGYIEVAWG